MLVNKLHTGYNKDLPDTLCDKRIFCRGYNLGKQWNRAPLNDFDDVCSESALSCSKVYVLRLKLRFTQG